MSNLVSTEWLAAHLKDVRVVDASWYMPDEKREPAKEFEAGHIAGARMALAHAFWSNDEPGVEVPKAAALDSVVESLGISFQHLIRQRDETPRRRDDEEHGNNHQVPVQTQPGERPADRSNANNSHDARG